MPGAQRHGALESWMRIEEHGYPARQPNRLVPVSSSSTVGFPFLMFPPPMQVRNLVLFACVDNEAAEILHLHQDQVRQTRVAQEPAFVLDPRPFDMLYPKPSRG